MTIGLAIALARALALVYVLRCQTGPARVALVAIMISHTAASGPAHRHHPTALMIVRATALATQVATMISPGDAKVCVMVSTTSVSRRSRSRAPALRVVCGTIAPTHAMGHAAGDPHIA